MGGKSRETEVTGHQVKKAFEEGGDIRFSDVSDRPAR